jgi:heme oxygenase (biliverdin-IX-beta and delta-forming)
VTVQVNKSVEIPDRSEIAQSARSLVRRAFKGSLATIDRSGGYPYASLITLATDASGAPTFLISTLARHTANLAADVRASVLIDETSALADPLQGARVTLHGRAEQTTGNDDVRRRFLARHPEAAFYADFPDFSFWRLDVEGAHYIGGFGRIFDLEPSELVLSLDGAESLIAAEAEIVEHMNADHADALELYATSLAGASPGGWRMTGIDPEGLDIVLGSEPRRVLFAERASTPETARKELVKLAAEARARRA